MKGKIMPFLIGLLLGVIIAVCGFFIYEKVSSDNNDNEPMQQDMQEMPGKGSDDGGTPPDMQNDDGNSIPEKPADEQNDNNVME